MKLDAYAKTLLTVIAVALVAIAVNLWAGHVVSPAQAANTNPGTASADSRSQTFEQMAGRVWVVEQVQKQQAKQIEALRSALESTVLNATRRGYFPDSNWSTVKWEPDVPPAGGN
jgi:Na+/H+-dicarboxylate symporter